METTTLDLTEQQRKAAESTDPPVIIDARTRQPYVLLSKAIYEHVREFLEDEREQQAVLRYSMEVAEQVVRETLLIMKPGEIYLADMREAAPHPVIIVSREDLNRGDRVVVVLCTSQKLAYRSTLANCVPFRA